jgi:AcrR family transcriptional regulator
MPVPFQAPLPDNDDAPPKGAAARTRALMVTTASAMMRRGLSPSVSEVAEAAGVSRSTAYRYFPTLADMLRAVVAEALGPILDWDEPATGAKHGLRRFMARPSRGWPSMRRHSVPRSASRWSQALEVPGDKTLGRGHRKALLARAVSDSGLAPEQSERLVQALSLTFGIEAMIVLKDICGLDDREATEVATWAAQALLQAARREAGLEPAT